MVRLHPLHKKLLRTLIEHWGQSLAVATVILCGVAAYLCVHGAYLNLKSTRDNYYRRYRFEDFEIHLDRAPASAVARVAALPGVREARGRIVRDVNLDIPGIEDPRVGRIVSMPLPQQAVINDIVITAGRYFDPGVQDQVIVGDRFARANGIAPGDRFQVAVESRKYTLHVVGLALSPEYIYAIRNLSEMVPSPERFGVLWVPEDFAETALDMQAAYNNIVGIADGPEHLAAILDAAKKDLDGYGVYAAIKSAQQISNWFLTDELQGLNTMANFLPTVFLAVAAAILLLLLNRMVRAERTQIGLLKAYGYSDLTVALHYVQYALILAGFGCLGGFVIGQWLAGKLTALYASIYQFPVLESHVHASALVRSMGMTSVAALIGALSAAYRAARIHPAEAMRPEAPTVGHRLWIERWPRVWSQINFTWKMVLRNMARNPVRTGLGALGVATSTALLLVGFFILDSIFFAMFYQFTRVQREDLKLSFQGERGKAALYELQAMPNIRRVEPILDYPFTVRNGWRRKDAAVMGVQPGGELQRLSSFDGRPIDVGDRGIVLTEQLASQLDAWPGTEVEIEPLMGRVRETFRVPVRGVTGQFLGATAYMNIEALSRLLGSAFAMNAALLRIDTGSDAAVNRAFKEVANIASVGFRMAVYDSLRNTLGRNLSTMNTVLLAFAGVISFAIIYNIASIALAERERELASLRVLGLTQAEVGSILYDENIVMSIFGTVLGLPLGLIMCRLFVIVFSTDLFVLPYHITDATFGRAIGLSLAFLLLANLAVARRIGRLDMIEVLKERE